MALSTHSESSAQSGEAHYIQEPAFYQSTSFGNQSPMAQNGLGLKNLPFLQRI
jgi:hypothetical protein